MILKCISDEGIIAISKLRAMMPKDWCELQLQVDKKLIADELLGITENNCISYEEAIGQVRNLVERLRRG